ncbi:hypothetical protein DM785_02655 [Deinococcus actinosclerus]|nr:hypothetical protein DM785_02655 [Deinococcus actinosclerus]
MDLQAFLTNPAVTQAVNELVRLAQPADLGYLGATYFPEQIRDLQSYTKKVTVLSGAMMANDVAPLSTGVQKGAMQRYSIGGSLIDTAAHMHYDGEDIEYLMALVKELRGDTVRPDSAEAVAYLNFVEMHLLTPLLMNRERKRMSLLGTGKVYQDGARDDDFTKPPVYNAYAPEQVVTVTTASGESIFGGADADFIRDTRERVDAARTRGVTIRELLMSSVTLNAILALPATRRDLGLLQLDVTTGGNLAVAMTQGAATQEQLNAKLTSLSLPPIRVYDGMWSDQVRVAGDPAGPVGTVVNVKYVPDGRVIYVPQANVMDMSLVDPTIPFRVTVFDRTAAIGVHIIGRQTGQDNAGVNVFGPTFRPGLNPSIDGDSGMAHMPFLNVPYALTVVNYQKGA